MSADPIASLGAAAATPATEPAERPRATLRARLKMLRQACRQMFGIPDFERYCAHLQAKHPGAPLPSEREFHAMAIDRRYGAARPRCC
jgi:uncharacterized short protein YbdD (DUF466 family)